MITGASEGAAVVGEKVPPGGVGMFVQDTVGLTVKVGFVVGQSVVGFLVSVGHAVAGDEVEGFVVGQRVGFVVCGLPVAGLFVGHSVVTVGASLKGVGLTVGWNVTVGLLELGLPVGFQVLIFQ